MVTHKSKYTEEQKQAYSERLNKALEWRRIPKDGRVAECAKITGTSQRGAYKWVNGKGFPTVTNNNLLAAALMVNANWLLSDVGSPDIEPGPTDPEHNALCWYYRQVPRDEQVQFFRWVQARAFFWHTGLHELRSKPVAPKPYHPGPERRTNPNQPIPGGRPNRRKLP